MPNFDNNIIICALSRLPQIFHGTLMRSLIVYGCLVLYFAYTIFTENLMLHNLYLNSIMNFSKFLIDLFIYFYVISFDLRNFNLV